MGSWSLYCEISNISITAGNDMVLLPLKENRSYDSYLPWVPATLPIFGKYDDYGGIEEIIEDENTKLIEEYFNITILEFTKIFTDLFAHDRDEAKSLQTRLEEFGKWDELKDWKWMFIDRQVYDFMIKPSQLDYNTGHHDFGNPGILKLLGAEYIGEETGPINKTYDPKRFNKHWKLQGRDLFADGTWIQYEKESLFSINGTYSSFKLAKFNILDFWEELDTKAPSELWRHYDKMTRISMLGWILGKSKHNAAMEEMDNFVIRRIEEILAKGSIENWTDDEKNFVTKFSEKREKKESILNKKLHEQYFHNLEIFGDSISNLVILRNRIYPMSGTFRPFKFYSTPQCGEFRLHNEILEKFTEINKSYYSEEVDE